MISNFYSKIEAKINEACNTIYDNWYTNYTQAVSAYNILFCRL